MSPSLDQMLDEMLAIIVREINPRQVILFGSHARGTAGPASDVDFLIIQDRPFTPGNTRRQQMAKLWRLLARYPVSQDILIYTPQEVEDWRQTKNHVIARALREGKQLYARA